MRTQPAALHDHPAGIDASVKKPLGIAYRIVIWILHEWLEILPPTIFFFIGFNFIVLTTNLLVAQYLVAVSNFMLATLAALVVGKAVLVANKMSLLRRYDRAPLIQPILYKTTFYWVVVFFARLLEHGIVVSPGESFGAGGEGYFRLALVPSLEQIEQAIAVWEKVSF